MIPENLVEFITQPGLPMCFGTCDSNLQTTVSHAFAVSVSNDRKNIRFVFPKIAMAERHLANFNNSGRVAFTIGHSISHVCYQFKGKYISHEVNIPDDLQLLGKNFAAFENMMVQTYGEQVREIFKKLNFGTEFISVTFDVEEIYNQTPGPGAGKKLNSEF